MPQVRARDLSHLVDQVSRLHQVKMRDPLRLAQECHLASPGLFGKKDQLAVRTWHLSVSFLTMKRVVMTALYHQHQLCLSQGVEMGSLKQ